MPSDADYLAEMGLGEDGSDLTTENESTQTAETEPTEGSAPPAPADMMIFEAGGKTYQVPLSANMKYKHAGAEVVKPLSTILNGYRQINSFEDKQNEFKKSQEAWGEQQKEFDALKEQSGSESWQKAQAIQKWSEENPEQFDYWWNLASNPEKAALEQQLGVQPGQQAGQQPPGGTGLPQPVVDMMTTMKQELTDLREWKSGYEKQQAEQKEQEEIQSGINQTNQEASDFQQWLNQEYPGGRVGEDGVPMSDIQIDAADENGVSLRHQIIKYGLDQGYPDFKISAKAYLDDTLRKLAYDKGRSEAVKQVKVNTQEGIVAESTTPLPSGENDALKPEQTRDQTWEQASEEAKDLYRSIVSQT